MTLSIQRARLAQAIRRAGWNVVFFHYRGSWGSEGQFSFAHVLEDVGAVVDQIAAPGLAGTGRIDFERIALVGHSMGGFAALISAVEVESVDCVVSIAGGNLGGLAKALVAAPEQIAAMAETLDGWAGPLAGATGAGLVEEIRGNLDRFDLTTHARVLGKKPLLLLAGRRDEVTPITLHHDPLVDALAATGSTIVTEEVFEDADHSFSGQRMALARRVVGWLESGCGRQD